MIRVVHMKKYEPIENEVLIPVDRSNKVLGNKFVMQFEKDRDRVCLQYKHWFYEEINNNNQIVLNELRRIYKIAKQKNVALGCWCYPKSCHAWTIKEFLDRYLKAPSQNTDEDIDNELMIIDGNILDIKDGFMIHQVNNCGKFAKGLAGDIRKKFPSHYDDYMVKYNGAKIEEGSIKKPTLLGDYVETTCGKLTIRGIFSQDGYGNNGIFTSKELFRKCLLDVAKLNLDAVYIPYGIGCGLGGGDWQEIGAIIRDYLPTAIIVKYKK